MSDRIEEILNKYEPLVLKNIEENNMNKIIEFLLDEQVDYIEEILTNYLDIFLINIDQVYQKNYKINRKRFIFFFVISTAPLFIVI